MKNDTSFSWSVGHEPVVEFLLSVGASTEVGIQYLSLSKRVFSEREAL